MAWRWYRPYFEHGIPLFRTSVPSSAASDLMPEPGRLEYECQKRFHAYFTFRKLGPTSYGFRERSTTSISFHYTPVMHGSLRFLPHSASVVVTGYLNWFPLAFSCLFLTGFLRDARLSGFTSELLIFPVGLVALLLLIYLVQRRKFQQVAEAAAGAWLHRIEVRPSGA